MCGQSQISTYTVLYTYGSNIFFLPDDKIHHKAQARPILLYLQSATATPHYLLIKT